MYFAKEFAEQEFSMQTVTAWLLQRASWEVLLYWAKHLDQQGDMWKPVEVGQDGVLVLLTG